MTVRDQTDRESLGVVCGHRRCHERQIGSGPEGHFPDGQELREMAEEVGFEPTVELPLRLISSQVPSTAQPLFRNRE